eukprot:g12518.t1
MFRVVATLEEAEDGRVGGGVGWGVELGGDREVRLAIMGQVKMLGEMATEPTFGLTDIGKTTSGALDAIDWVGGDSGEALSHLEGLFRALDG